MPTRRSVLEGQDLSEMDPWKDDRCRDFIVLNTIQRLRAYHLPPEEVMPPVERINEARSRNLLMLSRAQPDYRPCMGESCPLSEVGKATPGEKYEDHGEEPSCRSPMSTLGSPGPSPPTSSHDQPLCGLEKAKLLFFGPQAFSSSTSPRHLLYTPRQPQQTSSPARDPQSTSRALFSSDHANASVDKNPARMHCSAFCQPKQAADAVDSTSPSTAAVGQNRDRAGEAPPFPSLAESEEGGGRGGEGGVDGSVAAPSRASPTPAETPGKAAEERNAAAPPSCEVGERLIAYYQSLLTRGVVLDRLSYKELGFAWWVVGRDMWTAALRRPGTLRREALLITLRNFYYGLLSANRRRAHPGPAGEPAEPPGESRDLKKPPPEADPEAPGSPPPAKTAPEKPGAKEEITREEAREGGEVQGETPTQRPAMRRARAILSILAAMDEPSSSSSSRHRKPTTTAEKPPTTRKRARGDLKNEQKEEERGTKKEEKEDQHPQQKRKRTAAARRPAAEAAKDARLASLRNPPGNNEEEKKEQKGGKGKPKEGEREKEEGNGVKSEEAERLQAKRRLAAVDQAPPPLPSSSSPSFLSSSVPVSFAVPNNRGMVIPTGPSAFQREVEARIARRFSRSSPSAALYAYLFAESRRGGGGEAALMPCMVRCGAEVVEELLKRPPPQNPPQRELKEEKKEGEEGLGENGAPVEPQLCEKGGGGSIGAHMDSPLSLSFSSSFPPPPSSPFYSVSVLPQGGFPSFDDISYAQKCLLVWEAAGLLHAHAGAGKGQENSAKQRQRKKGEAKEGKGGGKRRETNTMTTAPRMTTRRMTAMAALSAENSRQSAEEPLSSSGFHGASLSSSSFTSSSSSSQLLCTSSVSRSFSEASNTLEEEEEKDSGIGEKGHRDEGDSTGIARSEPRKYIDYWQDFFPNSES